MNILGWSITRANRVTEEQARDARNAAAMTNSIGATALPGEATAGRIHREEIALAERILRHRMKVSYLVPTSRQDIDFRPDEFAATLRRRLGAAAAVEAEPQFAPILLEEIELIEHAVSDLIATAFMTEMALGGHGRVLLEDLYVRLGHAEATQVLGGNVVFASHLNATLTSGDATTGGAG